MLILLIIVIFLPLFLIIVGKINNKELHFFKVNIPLWRLHGKVGKIFPENLIRITLKIKK